MTSDGSAGDANEGTFPLSPSRSAACSFSARLDLREAFGFFLWRVEKGEAEDLRRRGLVSLGIFSEA